MAEKKHESPAATEAPVEAKAEAPLAAWVRVRDRSTGYEYDVAGSAFDHEMHVKVNKPANWPDLHGDLARPRPALTRTTLAGSPATETKKEH